MQKNVCKITHRPANSALEGHAAGMWEILQYSLHFYIVSTCYFYDLQISVKEKQL